MKTLYALLALSFALLIAYPVMAADAIDHVLLPESESPMGPDLASAAAIGADAGVMVRIAPGTLLTLAPGQVVACTLAVKNIGSNTWSTSNYILRSVNNTATATSVSPLAYNWRSGSTIDITAPTTSVLGEGGTNNATNSARLGWTAVGDDGMTGQASVYDVRRSGTSLVTNQWLGASRLIYPTIPSLPGTQDTLRVTGLHADSTYWFAVRTGDEVPNWASWSNVTSIRTATATGIFPFTIRAPQASGTFVLYLALCNTSNGQFFTDMLGTITVTVQTAQVAGTTFTPLVGWFDGDRYPDIGLYQPDLGNWSIASNTTGSAGISSFLPNTAPVLTSWASGNAYTALTGKFTRTIRTSVMARRPADGNWYPAFNTASGLVPQNAVMTNWAAGDAYVPLVGNFLADSLDEVMVRRVADGNLYPALNTGSGFVPQDAMLANWAGGTTYSMVVGNFLGDALDEVMAIRASDGNYYPTQNMGNGRLVPQDAAIAGWCPASTGPYIPLAGKIAAGSYDGMIMYRPSSGTWIPATFVGGHLVPGPTMVTGWATESTGPYIPKLVDLNQDGLDDVLCYRPRDGKWYPALNNGAGSLIPGSLMLDQWGRLTVVTGPAMASQSGSDDSADATALALPSFGPCPFQTSTTIRFSLPGTSMVTMNVYDVQGRLVDRPINAEYSAGQHTLDWQPNRTLSAGMYFARTQTRFGSSVTRIVRID